MPKRRAVFGRQVKPYPVTATGFSNEAFLAAVSESVAVQPTTAPDRIAICEASVGEARVTQPGRLRIRLIRAGWSMNENLYPAEVLRRDGPTAWPKGTLCYADHASDDEERAQPSGSVKNLAAVLTSNAVWDESEQALFAEARLFAPWRDAITDMAEHIGMSIRAWVTGERGERGGREGFIVESIPQGRSVDFVTVPAAGGAIISVLEAVGNQIPVAEARNAGHWFEANIHSHFSRMADEMFGEGYLTREERITLSSAVGDALAAFSSRIERDAAHLYDRDPYAGPPKPEPIAMATDEDAPEPVPAPVEADESAPAEPAADPDAPAEAPADPPPTTPVVTDVTEGAPPPTPAPPIIEEEPVSGIQTGAPPEQAGTASVPDNEQPPTSTPAATTESLAATVQQMLAEAVRPLTEQIAAFQAREGERDAEARTLRNRQTASEAVSAALRAPEHADVAASITTRVTTRVAADVPTTAEGAVDDARLGEVIAAVVADEATHVRRERANALAEAGVGLPYGMGSAPAQEATDDGLDAELESFFSGALGLSEQAAKVAAKGRG